MKKSEEIFQFFGAYFHEDWDLEASSPDDVVYNYLKDTHGTQMADDVISSINEYLAAAGDDASIENDLYEKFGCYYLPSADGFGARQWLMHVVQLLSQNK